MNKHWKETKLDEIAEIIIGGTPKTHITEYWIPEIDWVTAKDISESKLSCLYNTQRKISRLGLDESSAVILPSYSTVLIARGATMGKICYIDHPMALNQTCYGIVAKKQSDVFFVYYLMRNLSQYLQKIAHGTVFNTVIGSGLKNIVIKVPSYAEQKKIGYILHSLDEEINIITKKSLILEKLIQSIFKSWFIDFEGQTEFYDSKLGQIPKGWSVKTIDNLANITSGKRPKLISKIKNTEMSIPLYGSGGIMGYVSTPYFKEPIIITGRVGTIGIIHLVNEPCFPSDNTIVIIPNLEEYLFLLFHQLKQIDFNSFISGSTQPLITQTNIKNEVIILPERAILEKFHKFAKNIFDIISINNSKINTLNNIRDSLLPKLISGEIKV